MASDTPSPAPSAGLARRHEVRQAARLVCLIRLLLLAMAVGAFAIVGFYRDSAYFGSGADFVVALLIAVMASSLLLVVTVPWVVYRWQLVLHLVFDLLWCGVAIALSGGVMGPGTPLIFAVVLTANLALPRVLPFVLPAIGSLVLAVVALIYVAESVPFPVRFISENPRLFSPPAILGTYLVQVLALFVVDALGQTLARRMREQQLLVGDLLDQLGDGVIALDRRGGPVHVNDEAIRLLSLADGARHDPLAAVAAEPQLAVLGDMLAGSGTVIQALPGPDHRWLRARVGDLHGRRGRVVGRVLTLADETDLRRAEENARRFAHLAELGEMAAGIAHEVRNPLSSLRGCAQELAEVHRQGGDDGAALCRIIVGEADRLARIVDDVLRLARQDAPRLAVVPVAAVVTAICDQIRRREDLPPGLHCECACGDEAPRAWCDADHLRQIVMNLLDNAIEAIRSQGGDGTVRLCVERAEERIDNTAAVAIDVIDTGPGIDPSLRDELFTPFVSGRAQGTGLGLSVVQRLIKVNGGEIAFESAPGQGTVFRVLLPESGSQSMASPKE